MKKISTVFLITLVIYMGCATSSEYKHEDGLESFSTTGFESHVTSLASDAFQGRKPFTEGEKKSITYIKNEFEKIGVEPGNDTSYFQEVPMVEITARPDSVMQVKGGKKNFSLRGYHDYILMTQRPEAVVSWTDEEVVFAGFGVVAPEYNWNDYEGLDVKGKIVLVLVNDPGFGGDDTTFFKGNTMTYYGRWTYKYEEAARQGAKGCFVIHNTVPASYPFGVVQNYWNASRLQLDERGKNTNYSEAVGWISMPATEKLFSGAGLDFNTLQTAARKPGFKGLSLNLKISTAMTVKSRYDKSYNVVAKVSGSEKNDEYIIYTAHWDHLGIGKKNTEGDSIFNGALDNATGTAALLEIAKAFSKTNPKRTVVFLAVTAEEQGLWGSAYYAQNPIYDPAKTVANINIDGVNPFGRMKDVMVVGKGQNNLEDILKQEATLLDRVVGYESRPQDGMYFRSDHFSFAKIGIPALFIETGSNYEGNGKEFGEQLKANYNKKAYHQPSDEVSLIKFDGAIDDIKLLFQVGKRLAFSDTWPEWAAGSEFKAIREKSKK
jgi:Zn-dependent M28 family amino/carboxypeptidase